MAYKQNNPFSRKTSSPFNNESDDLLSNIKNKKFKIVESSGEPQPITKGDAGGNTYTNINERGGEGNRIAYIPTYESLIYDERTGEPKLSTSPDSPSTQNVYETGERMVSDSLDLVNKGQNVAAAQVFGRDLSEELRNAKNIGEYDAVLERINRGHQNEANFNAAKKIGDQGYVIGTDPTNPKEPILDHPNPKLRATYDQPRIDKFRERYQY